MLICDDLREYIELLASENELSEVNHEVDWNLEMGALIRRINFFKAPAPLFNQIKDYLNFRALGSPAGASRRQGKLYSRIALSLGLKSDTPSTEIIEMLSHLNEIKPIPPRICETGPCKENIFIGHNVNLLKLPAPYLHDGDGGRYLGTWHVVITQTPDGSWTNWGVYRVMVHDEKNLGVLIVPTQHIGMHFNEWKKIKKDMPFAIALGTDPVTPIFGSIGLPENVSEPDIIGGFRKKPVDVVKCETQNLHVPAKAEIIIEGTVSIDKLKEEGPFGEYTGYMTNTRIQRPVFQVSAITHRNNPILPVVCPGEPVDDHLCMSLSLAADALALLRQKKIPVLGTFIPPTAALHLLVISIDKSKCTDQDIITRIGNIIWSEKIGTLLPKIIVVDKDIDPTNIDTVLWAFAVKCHPERGVHFFKNSKVFPLSPYLSKEEKSKNSSTTTIFDCTWPCDWPKEFLPKKVSFNTLWPKRVQDKILENWNNYGYENYK